MVRSVDTEALKNAIQGEAKQNAGFLYIQDQETVSGIRERYENSEKTNGLRTKSSVSEENIRLCLSSLAESKHYITAVRDEDVYFLDPFKLPGDESSSLKKILEQLFRTQRYHTQTSIVDFLRKADIRIAEDDLPLFVREMKRRKLLREVGETTAYYRPGSSLAENSDLEELSVILESDAGRDGCLTVSGIGAALDIDTVDEDILTDLTERVEALFELEDAFLVNTEKALNQYVSQAVNQGLAREFEEALRSNDWVMIDDRLETVLRREASSALSAVDNEQDMFYDLKSAVIDAIGVEERTVEIEGEPVKLYERPDEIQSLVNTEAERIRSDVASKVDNDSPESMPFVMREYATFNTYGSDERINTYVHERIETAARDAIDADEDINVWETIET